MSFDELMFEPNYLVNFVFAAGLSALLLALGHTLFPDRALPRTTAGLLGRYTYGTFVLWLGHASWVLLAGYGWQLALALLVIDGVGGLIVMATYGFDALYAATRRSAMAEATDDELRPEG